jgi:hypothetical protein
MRRRSTAGAIYVSLFLLLLARHVKNSLIDCGEVADVSQVSKWEIGEFNSQHALNSSQI